MNAREQRLARNEAVFREVNERSRDLSESWNDAETTFEIVCECCDAKCVRGVEVTPQEYRGVRKHRAQFFVVPGHENLSIEAIVEVEARFAVVEKSGDAADYVATFAAS